MLWRVYEVQEFYKEILFLVCHGGVNQENVLGKLDTGSQCLI